MYGIDILIQKVLLLMAMVACGFVLRKTNILNVEHAKGFANTVIYLAQPAMIIYSFLEAKFSYKIMLVCCCVLVFSMFFHFMYYGISLLLFRKAPIDQQIVLRFSTVFTNAGFMGIPLISELISPIAAVYATFYVISFNVFCWSLGCYIYSGDKSYISAKKMLLNPATIPTYIGLAIFIIGGLITLPDSVKPIFDDFLTPVIRDNILYILKCTVIPLSMMMVGIRLAEAKLGVFLTNKNVPVLIIVRLILIPLAIMFIMKLVSLTGTIPADIIVPASTVLVISSSTPAAAIASVFAEKFNKGAAFSSTIVSATTLISLITMPIISTILLKVF